MKIRPVGAEMLHADGQTDGHDEATGVADKSLARPGKKQATVTEGFDVHISYL
jgi:hypothetical protein